MLPSSILGMQVQSTVGQIRAWSSRAESRYVCVATVNNVMESHDSQNVSGAMNEADLVTPDGYALGLGIASS
jgi:UDP-N-acetyl-D-mannosaminuronic acid transferase (WecB/TagA/CpsF family)